MPLDDRLRDALHREAGMIRPDVEEHLVRVRGRSRSRTRRAPASLAAAAMIIVAAVGIWSLDIDPTGVFGPLVGQSPRIASPSPQIDEIAGTYEVRLDAGMPGVGDGSLEGVWVLILHPDSRASLMPPPTYGGGDAGIEDAVYAVIGDRLAITLFASGSSRACAGVGDYRWVRRGGRLLLEAIDDRCQERVAVLSSAEWSRVRE